MPDAPEEKRVNIEPDVVSTVETEEEDTEEVEPKKKKPRCARCTTNCLLLNLSLMVERHVWC